MGVITVSLVRWFFFEEGTADTYGGKTYVLIESDNGEEIKIPVSSH